MSIASGRTSMTSKKSNVEDTRLSSVMKAEDIVKIIKACRSSNVKSIKLGGFLNLSFDSGVVQEESPRQEKSEDVVNIKPLGRINNGIDGFSETEQNDIIALIQKGIDPRLKYKGRFGEDDVILDNYVQMAAQMSADEMYENPGSYEDSEIGALDSATR